MFLGDACTHSAEEIADLFGDNFQGVYVRDSSQEDFVVEDSSTVSMFSLKRKLWRVFWFWALRDIFTDFEKDCAGCKETVCCFV
jgi:hypothetical protein